MLLPHILTLDKQQPLVYAPVLQAANVAMQHQRHRMHEVVAAVAQRLVGIGRVAAAAELQEGINDIQGKQHQHSV